MVSFFEEKTVLLIFLKYSSHSTLEHMVFILQVLRFFPLLGAFFALPSLLLGRVKGLALSICQYMLLISKKQVT